MAHNLAQLAFSHHNHVWSKQMQPHIDALILSNVNMDCLVESNSVFAYKTTYYENQRNIEWTYTDVLRRSKA